MFASVNNDSYMNYDAGTGVIFNQARLSAEFGTTPWSVVPFAAPPSETLLAKLGVPPGPPFEAELATYSGESGCFNSTHWTSHKVKMTSGGTSGTPVEITPKGLSGQGCDFSVYLEH